MRSYSLFNNNQTKCSMPEGNRAFGLAVLLAVIAHAVLLIYVKIPSNHKPWTPVISDVQLKPLHEQLVKLASSDQGIKSDNRSQKEQSILSTISKRMDQKQKTNIRHATLFVKQSEVEPVAEVMIKTDRTINSEAPKQAITYGELLESAHLIVKEDAKNMPKPKDNGVLLTDRAFLPILAQALAKKEKVQGVTKYADGMLKVVTSSGTEYCMLPSQQLIIGAFDSDPIPMTCP